MKTIIVMILLTFNLAFAGNEGGGGGAVVCRDANKKIISAELLDLFEAPYINYLNISYSKFPYEKQVEKALKKLDLSPFDYYLLKEAIADVKKKFKFLPDGVSLNQPADVGENTPTVVKEGCLLEGIGFYTKKDELLVARSTFEKLNETDKAAFIIHEAVYKVYRYFISYYWYGPFREPSSVLSREMTAQLFSQDISAEEATNNFKKNIGTSIPEDRKIILPLKTVENSKLEFRVKYLREGAGNEGIGILCQESREQVVLEGGREFKGEIEIKGCKKMEISFSGLMGVYGPYYEISFYYNGEFLGKSKLIHKEFNNHPFDKVYAITQKI